ncbi:MAG: cupin domain-containing protein [bacterium]
MKRFIRDTRRWLWLGLVAALPLSVGCAAAGLGGQPVEAPHPVVDALFGDARTTESLKQLAALVELNEGEAFKLTEIGRDGRSSHHLVAIRDREDPHRHDTHDLFVFIVRGYGTMRIGNEARPVGEGSVLYVPRGTVHAFRNTSPEPAIAYAIYSPPFDGKDKVPAE